MEHALASGPQAHTRRYRRVCGQSPVESTVQLAGIGLPHGAAHRIQPLRDGAGLECKIKKGTPVAGDYIGHSKES